MEDRLKNLFSPARLRSNWGDQASEKEKVTDEENVAGEEKEIKARPASLSEAWKNCHKAFLREFEQAPVTSGLIEEINGILSEMSSENGNNQDQELVLKGKLELLERLAEVQLIHQHR